MRTLSAVAVLLLVAACQAPPAEMTVEERQAIADELHQLNLQLDRFSETNDLEGMLTYWVADPSVYFVGDPASFLQGVRLLHSKPEIREFFAPMDRTRSSTNFSVLSDHVAVLSPTLAIQVLEQRYSVTDTLGNIGPEYPETATTVWVKEDGTWKILHFHQSWSTTPIETSGG